MDDERWEHRAWFGGPAEPPARLAREGEEVGAEYRTDTYLLTDDGDLLAKLRGGARYEVKRRTASCDGLERWVMTSSLQFPLGADDAAPVLPDAPASALADAGALAAYAATVSTLTVASVRKHRRRYRLGAAEAEITAVQANRVVAETVGIEAAAFADARAAAERLGTIDLPNRDYGAWLRLGDHQRV